MIHQDLLGSLRKNGNYLLTFCLTQKKKLRLSTVQIRRCGQKESHL